MGTQTKFATSRVFGLFITIVQIVNIIQYFTEISEVGWSAWVYMVISLLGENFSIFLPEVDK